MLLYKALVVSLLSFCVVAVLPTESTKTGIVTTHNLKRDTVAPLANPRLGNLVWNTTLASTASRYADGCSYGHNPNRGRMVGENIAATTGAGTEDFFIRVSYFILLLILPLK